MRKTKSQKIHFKRRFYDRVGVWLTKNDLAQISLMIKQGKATLVKRQSQRVTIWNMTYAEKNLNWVYDSKTKNVVTVLYPEEKMNEKDTAIE